MLAERFMTQVSRAFFARRSGLELLPGLLSEACVEVLAVAGAGISMTVDELRVPLGASDECAARAEALQTTLGEGPCLFAITAAEPVVFDEPRMETCWPLFHNHVLNETPYRSIASVPLRSTEGACVGALDLYSTSPDVMGVGTLDEVSHDIGAQISTLLFDAPPQAFERGLTMPLWLSNSSVADRMTVWVAVGMLIEHADLSNADALSALRARAFGHEQTLDEVACQVADGELKPEALLD